MGKNKNILITGGAGYIGSHMVRFLLEKGCKPVVFDNLCTGYRQFVPKGVPFVNGDLCNKQDIQKAFKRFPIDSVMHFAASTVLPESIEKPLEYYKNNVVGSLNLIEIMLAFRVNKMIFSSTAAVYGEPKKNPIKESHPPHPKNPYGIGKLMVERVLMDISRKSDLKFVALRYFNVAGAHPTEKIGPTLASQQSLVPVVMKALRQKKSCVKVFGDDYSTPDGTCIRDYIYVMDLCRAHFLALQALSRGVKNIVLNLGSEKGYSVMEILDAAEKISGRKIFFKIGNRRPGDMPKVVADAKKARKLLRWTPQADINTILKTALEWEKKGVTF